MNAKEMTQVIMELSLIATKMRASAQHVVKANGNVDICAVKPEVLSNMSDSIGAIAIKLHETLPTTEIKVAPPETKGEPVFDLRTFPEGEAKNG